jgi:hypothetical protein
MLVNVLSFGSNWWQRSKSELDPKRCAYYNSTGVCCGNKIRRHWIVPGILRLNGVSNFDTTSPGSAIGKTFECSELGYAFGGNRLLFRARVPNSLQPDCYLITLTRVLHSSMNFHSEVWKSMFTEVLAVSQLRRQQETMLLMHAGDWVQTTQGFWQLHVPDCGHKVPCLIRLDQALCEGRR